MTPADTAEGRAAAVKGPRPVTRRQAILILEGAHWDSESLTAWELGKVRAGLALDDPRSVKERMEGTEGAPGGVLSSANHARKVPISGGEEP
jgi:hypothetical protein